MKQDELAKLVGVRRETIVHLENGKYNPSLELAMNISKVFNVAVEDLFEFLNEDNKQSLNDLQMLRLLITEKYCDRGVPR